MSNIPPEISALLSKIAREEGFENPSIFLLEKNRREDANIGDLYYFKIKDQRTASKLDLLVKKSSELPIVRHHYPVGGLYSNEYEFYQKIWPTFRNFQQAANIRALINEIPKCYGADMNRLKEAIVLENLKAMNYYTIDNHTFLEKPYLELIFDRYGKFHAVSMAYRIKFPRVFDELAKLLYNYWGSIDKLKSIEKSVISMFQECQQYLLEEPDKRMVEKFKEYAIRGHLGFTESCKYTGTHLALLHGDSSSNNMMFKYDRHKKPTDIKFHDFQIVRIASPVFDLSNCLYSSTKSDVYEELEYYLKIYYDAFSVTMTNYDCVPSAAYSFNELKQDWKTYSRFGFIMGLLQIRSKCTREDIPTVASSIDNPTNSRVFRMDTVAAKKLSVDLIKHMYQNGFL